MELSDLRIFKAVVTAGGINGAARLLHRVPSNITTRIRQLEADIGAALFLRQGQRLVLSSRGKALLGYTDRLLNLADEAGQAVRDQTPRGELRLGALESTTASRLPALLASFHRHHRDIAVTLRTGTNDAMTRAVIEAELDLAFVVEKPVDPRLASAAAFAERLVLIGPKDLPPLRSAQDVRGLSVLAFPSGCAYRRRLERWLGQRRAPALRVLELASYHAMVACAAAGAGIALLPESVLAVVGETQLSRHPVPASIGQVRTHLVWRRDDLPAPALALREWASQQIGSAPARARGRSPARSDRARSASASTR